MKRSWIALAVAFAIAICFGALAWLYTTASAPMREAERSAAQAAVKAGLLESVSSTSLYSGTAAYCAVFGADRAGTSKAVLIPLKGSGRKRALALPLDRERSEKRAIATARAQGNFDRLLHCALGVEGGRPVWEVAYRDKSGKLNYVYASPQDGTWWKKLSNL